MKQAVNCVVLNDVSSNEGEVDLQVVMTAVSFD